MEAKGVFHEDVLQEILSKLTVRQLLQFRSISRTWCSIIDKYSFIHKHYQTQYARFKDEGDIPLFCENPLVFGQEEDPTHFCLLSKKLDNNILHLTPHLSRDSSHYCSDKPELFNYLYCGGVVNGVVLLRWAAECYGSYGLWNPAIRVFEAIPHSCQNQLDKVKEYTNFFGMGFDAKCNDFKIVRSIDRSIGEEDAWEKTRIYEIYSHRANSWRRIEPPMPHLGVSMNARVTDGYFNGAYCWPTNEYDRETGSYPCRFGILFFNFSTELFKFIDAPPPAWQGKPELEWCIDKYKDFLAVIFTRRNVEDKACLFDIWVVSKFHADNPTVPLSWQYLFTIGPTPLGCSLCFRAFAWDGDMLLLVPMTAGEAGSNTTGECECAFYNPTTYHVKRLGLGFLTCLRYVESLFPLSKI